MTQLLLFSSPDLLGHWQTHPQACHPQHWWGPDHIRQHGRFIVFVEREWLKQPNIWRVVLRIWRHEYTMAHPELFRSREIYCGDRAGALDAAERMERRLQA